MVLACTRLEANFPAEKLRLVNRAAARLLWDEHGGTFVLRVNDLQMQEAPELQGESCLRLEAALPEAAVLARHIEKFAGDHALRLGPAKGPDLLEKPLLVACHLPDQGLFIFCEEPQLTVRRSGESSLEILVTGNFKARRVSCRETDLVIHLDMAAMARLLAGMLAWTRAAAP